MGVDALMAGSCAAQNDSDNFFDYQFEPVWKFYTGGVHHTLLTGFEYQRQVMDTDRVTADLPNINNIFAPVTTGIVTAASHSSATSRIPATMTIWSRTITVSMPPTRWT